jgi:hypothetical protein
LYTHVNVFRGNSFGLDGGINPSVYQSRAMPVPVWRGGRGRARGRY